MWRPTAPRSADAHGRSASRPRSASGSSTSSIRGSKMSESAQLRSAKSTEKPGTFGISGYPSASRRRRAGQRPLGGRQERQCPARADPEREERQRSRGEEAVRDLHDRRVAEQSARQSEPQLVESRREQHRKRGGDERSRERLRLQVQADVDVPLAFLPRTRPGQRPGQQRPHREERRSGNADGAPAARPAAGIGDRNDRDCVRGERDEQADDEGDVGIESAEDTERERAGAPTAAASRRRRRRPARCRGRGRRLPAKRRVQPTAIAVHAGRSRQPASARA